MIKHFALFALAAIVTACSDSPAARVSMAVDTIGDTIVVRNVGSGVWGDSARLVEEVRIGEMDGADEYTFGRIAGIAVDAAGTMYVLDQQAVVVRRFDAGGKHIGSFARKGAGPGELGTYPSGMGFLPDGRVLVRDFNNARINIYSPDGQSLGQVQIPAGYSTSAPMSVDSAGHIYTQVVAERHDNGTFSTGLIKINERGDVLDTLRTPYPDFKPTSLIARSADGGGTASYSMPFGPGEFWMIDGTGRMVSAISSRYAIELRAGDGKIRRIERETAPVPVTAGEAASAKENTTRGLRMTQPDWSWNGPGIPDTKPPIRDIELGADGRIWVQRAEPGIKEPADTTVKREPGAPPPMDSWGEPVRYDVFEPDGQYLGAVTPPPGFRLMFMRGQHVWGILFDDNDVPFVARMRIEPAGR